MTPFDPKKTPPRELTTAQGVKIIVDQGDDPPPEPAPDPGSEPWDTGPAAIVIPLGQSEEDRAAFMKSLCEAYGPFIHDSLHARKDLSPASKEDLEQGVIVILAEQIRGRKPLGNVKAFLRRVIRNELIDHRRRWRPDVDRDADFDAEASPYLDPEEEAARDEQWERVEHHFEKLTKEEQNAVRLVDIDGKSFAEAAAALGVAVGTVVTRHARAQAKLAEFARESDRETELGLRRQPPPGR